MFFAMWNAPFLKATNLPSFDLVPSGAIRKDVFSFIIAFSTTFRLDKAFLIFVSLSSFFSGIFGTKLPGEGSIYTYQSLYFKRPIYIGDEVEAIVTVIDIDVDKKKVRFTTQCKVNSKVCIDGEAEIIILWIYFNLQKK